MNCVNCGAPMALFERRRYYFCRHCGTFHFLDAPDLDGLQVLHRPESARQCSVCAGGLAKALVDQVHSVEYCEQCRGVLMARATFAAIVARRRAWATGTPVEPLPFDRTELARQVKCPSCQSPMEVHPYYGPGNIVMDSCGGCDLVWLDFGEMKQIVDAPGRDRGSRDALPPRQAAVTLPAEEDTAVGSGATHPPLLDLLRDLLS